jgi:DNA-binding transcriptional LysR family regulator
LVWAGRGLVATPRAFELCERVGQLVPDGETLLRPAETATLKQLSRTFTLPTREGFAENFGAALIALFGAKTPGVRECFVHKSDKDSTPLRDMIVDLEAGVVDKTTASELRVQSLFHDHLVGVVHIWPSLESG